MTSVLPQSENTSWWNKYKEIHKVVLIYAAFGFAWIFLSDTILNWFVEDQNVMAKISLIKGSLFIVVTSILLSFLIIRLSKNITLSTATLRKNQELLQFVVKNSSDTLVIIQAEGGQRYVSPGAQKIFGFSRQELENKTVAEVVHPDDLQRVTDAIQDAADHPEKTVTVEYRHAHKNKSWVFAEAIGQSFIHDPAVKGIIASIRDITERKRKEEETAKLHEELAQSQKIESVGRLAGGVAHDFNNMLGVILGYAEMALMDTEEGQPMHSALCGIQQAAQRSADLTSQLLAFARKQPVSPKVIDLNFTVESILTMLKRLIGENIDLVWLPEDDLETIKMDPSQLSQVLTNLCVNARHAIQDTGKITIKTNNTIITETDLVVHPFFVPGKYVLLTVSDTGCGMDEETLLLMFEPFFTTKKEGLGTGLGLAMTYGVVKQNNGFIIVDSKPGHGSTFKIYLPCYKAKGIDKPQQVTVKSAEPGHETILLVEDEPLILEITTKMLEHLGYQILSASTPGEAISLAQKHAGEIDLLVTDVVMPEMNGRELAQNLLSLYPGLKCLFMSGYTSDVIAHHGVLEEGVSFIQKPFAMNDLAAKVKNIIHPKPN